MQRLAEFLSVKKLENNANMLYSKSMLTQYIQAAMRKAKYKLLEGDEGFYGEIPGFQGVWGNATTLEECREDLAEALETWILFRVSRGLKVPAVGRHKLEVEFAPA